MIKRPASDKNACPIKAFEKNGVYIFKFHNDLTLFTKFDELTKLITHALAKGKKNIAISFTQDSYINTSLVANLVQYWKLVQDKGGTFALIQPGNIILKTLKTIGLTEFITIYSAEEDLGK